MAEESDGGDSDDSGSGTDSETESHTGGDSDTDSDSDTDTDSCIEPIEWIVIDGGNFMMGADDIGPSTLPVHEVEVEAFEIAETEATVAQYICCYLSGWCTEPMPDTADISEEETEKCTWSGDWGIDAPVNCINWEQADVFCEWAEGRLPSEAEWEYAARNEGDDISFPWGDQAPTCEEAVMNEDGEDGCSLGGPWEVCQKQPGSTQQGLCDVVGNVSEWTADCEHSNFEGAPQDGTAWITDCDGGGYARIVKGGSFDDHNDSSLRPHNRPTSSIGAWTPSRGVRCARGL